MKESFWGYWIIVLGIFVVIIMMLVSNITTTNTQDYYLIKDVTEASLVDAVDYAYYRQYKELKINREKFIENFLRRFAENVSLSTYTIDFYDIYEAPPKASVKITTESGSFMVNGDSSSFDIVNRVDAILELSGNASSQDSASSSYKETTTGKDFTWDGTSGSSNNSQNTTPPPNRCQYDFSQNGLKSMINDYSPLYDKGLYDCTRGSQCEITSLGNLRWAACADWQDTCRNTEDAKNYDQAACYEFVNNLYSSLPKYVTRKR